MPQPPSTPPLNPNGVFDRDAQNLQELSPASTVSSSRGGALSEAGSRKSSLGQSRHLKTPTSHSRPSRHPILITPYTPRSSSGKGVSSLASIIASPTESLRRQSGGSVSSQSSDETLPSQLALQLQTPKLTPHKRLGMGIQFAGSSLGPLLFPPAPSTLGAGRKVVMAPRRGILGQNMLDLGGSIKVEMAEDDDIDQPEMPKLIVKRKRASKRQRRAFSDSEPEEEPESVEGLRKVSKKLNFGEAAKLEGPSTPTGQVIDFKYAYEKNIKEQNTMAEDEDDLRPSLPLPNPFVGSFPTAPRKIPKEYERFEHEMVLVNQRTGKTIVRPLTKREKAIKPKRLFMTELGDDEDSLLATPQTPENTTVPDPMKTVPRVPEIDEDDEPIRKESIINPFVGSFEGSSTTRTNKRKTTRPKRYDEIEYISHNTGKRVKRRMTPEEIAIRPKKLKFI